ncbi:MAG TPA: FHA domain-containing protein [Pyrinomonadaceae bacterium]|nr:FHA domain-containing protein [Pyrinomonadaceae bacterium]
MIEVVLTFPTPEGSRQTEIAEGKLTIGRGDVDLRFNDQSLSRHHATIYREGERIWILDENSTNGTFVNGAEVSVTGTPLRDFDSIRLGNETVLTIQIRQLPAVNALPQPEQQKAESKEQRTVLLPFIIAGVAVLIIGLSAIVIGSRFINRGAEPREVVTAAAPEDSIEDERDDETDTNSTKPKLKPIDSPASINSNSASEETPAAPETPVQRPAPPNKTYLAMTEEEKRQFIETQAEQVARMIGNRSGEAVTPAAVTRIKDFVDEYARRANKPKLPGECNFTRADLGTLLERASRNAPFIIRAFNSEGLAPQIGLYLAMIESEHCTCLQSPTGPIGMFQFTYATAMVHFKPNDGVRRDASPTNGDLRCQPEPAARAAASYMKFLTGRYGTGPRSVPLAVASYNSGEGGLSTNLATALEAAEKQERSFWTLMLNAEKLSAQFQKENRKYVPKFFAAAIIGENPTVFGVNLPPLSSNTK